LLFKSKLASEFHIFGSRDHYWTSNGLIRAWNSKVLSHVDTKLLQPGDIIDSNESTQRVFSPLASNVSSITNHPNNIVFLVADSNGALPTISKLTPSQACQQLVLGYTGKSNVPFFNSQLPSLVDFNQVIKQFKALIEGNEVSSYIINILGSNNKELKPEEVNKLIHSINDGSAATAKTASGFSQFSPITSLHGFKTLETPSEGANKWEQQSIEFLKTNYPSML